MGNDKTSPQKPGQQGRVGLVNHEKGTHSANAEERIKKKADVLVSNWF